MLSDGKSLELTRRLGSPRGVQDLVIGLGILAWILDQLLRAIPFASLRRSKDDRHPTRTAILQYITDHPGVTLQELDKALKLNRGTSSYHLRRLRRQRLIATVRAGRETHFFLSENWPDEKEAVSALLRGRCLSIAAAVTANPGTHQKELLDRFHTSRKVIRPNLDMLVERDLLEEKPISRYRRYYPTNRLNRLLPFLAWRTTEPEDPAAHPGQADASDREPEPPTD